MEPGTRPLPGWFDDAKLGIFVHWTAAAVPAFAPVDRLAVRPRRRGRLGGGDALLALRRVVPELGRDRGQPGRAAPRRGARRPALRRLRRALPRRARGLAARAVGRPVPPAGARYVVLVTKHHDGVLLWPSATPNPHKERWASERDLVGDLAAAVRARGMRFGTYYSGGLDWTFGGLPITRPRRRCSRAIPQIARVPRLRRRPLARADRALPARTCCGTTSATRRRPTSTRCSTATTTAVPDGRRQQPLRLDGASRRAACTATSSRPSTPPPATPTASGRPPAASARRSATTARRPRTATWRPDALVRMFIDVVAHGGNLLLNVGPTADGRHPVGAGPAAARARLVAPHQRRRDLRHPSVDAHRRHHRRGPRRALHDPATARSTPSCCGTPVRRRRRARRRPAPAARPSTSSATTRPLAWTAGGRRLRRHPPRPSRRRPRARPPPLRRRLTRARTCGDSWRKPPGITTESRRRRRSCEPVADPVGIRLESPQGAAVVGW